MKMIKHGQGVQITCDAAALPSAIDPFTTQMHTPVHPNLTWGSAAAYAFEGWWGGLRVPDSLFCFPVGIAGDS